MIKTPSIFASRHPQKKLICSDFDGTICKIDMLDTVFDNFLGKGISTKNDLRILRGENINKVLQESFYNLNVPEEEALLSLGKDIIDPHFSKFVELSHKHEIPLYIISSGFKQWINQQLPYIPINNIYANRLNITENKWKIDTPYVNKRNIINTFKKQGYYIIYIGDGTSDFCVADIVDELYAKKEKMLHKYCIEHNIPVHTFDNFLDLLP